MTELLSGVEAPSDAELISRVRGGDVGAYGQLFSRHVDAARRLGRQLVRGHDVDDLVSDAFAKTLQVLQSGGGPDVAFRAYLLTSVRRLHVDRIRASKKVQPTDDMTVYDDGLPFNDTAVANFENGAAAKAFSSLPERWQLVLWHLEVEGQKPAEIAPLLGMSANSVSALAYRAREGLRQAFLTMHLADCATEQCRWVNEHLGAYVRKGLSRRDTTKVEEHLDECRRCTAMYLELDEVNSNLAGIIAPLLLGAAAAGYVSSAGAGLTGVSGFIGRIRDALSGDGGAGSASTASSAGGAGSAGGAASAGATAAAGSAAATGSIVTAGGMITAGGVVAAGVAAVTTAALVLGGGPKDVVTEADQPVGIVQAPPSAPGADGDATGEGGAAGQGDNPDSDTTLISPDEERQGDAGPETDGADGDATGLKADGTDSDSETTDGSGTGAAPAPGDAPAQEPAEDPNDGQQDGPQNQPGGEPGGDPGGPDDGPGGDDGPGDLPLPVDPPKLPEVEVPLPPVEVPLPPVETPDRGNADSPGAGDGTNPDNGSGSGDANDGTDGGTESGTGGGPGRSDGERGGGNDNVSPPDTGNGSNSGSGPATEPQQDPAPPGDAGGQTGGGQDGDTQPGETGGQTGGGQEGDPGTGDTGGDAGGDTDGDTPVVVPTELSISDLAIIDGLLVLDVAGDPVLPSAVTVTLTSDPAGVTFGQGGTCQVTGNTAVCPTVPDFLGAGLLTLRAMSDGAPTLRAAIPLEIPADLESASLRFTVSSADATVSGQTSTTMELGSDDEAPPADTGDASPEDETLPDEDETPADEDDPAEVEDPETNEFGFVGDPVVTQVGSGGERHRYTVRVELTGVADGDLVTLRLLDSQTRFCDDVDCSPSPGSDEERSARERVVAVALSEGQKRFVYEFDAWLPGGASVSLCATRGDEASSNCEADTGEPVASEPSAKKSSGR